MEGMREAWRGQIKAGPTGGIPSAPAARRRRRPTMRRLCPPGPGGGPADGQFPLLRPGAGAGLFPPVPGGGGPLRFSSHRSRRRIVGRASFMRSTGMPAALTFAYAFFTQRTAAGAWAPGRCGVPVTSPSRSWRSTGWSWMYTPSPPGGAGLSGRRLPAGGGPPGGHPHGRRLDPTIF